MENEYDQVNEKYSSIALNNGLTYGLILTVIGLAPSLLGLGGNSAVGIILGITALLIYVFTAYKSGAMYKDQLGGQITFGKAFIVGFMACFIAALIASVASTLYNVIDPSAMTEAMAKVEESFEDRGMSDDEIEQAMKMTEMFQGPIPMLIAGVIGGAIYSAIAGLVGAFINKND